VGIKLATRRLAWELPPPLTRWMGLDADLHFRSGHCCWRRMLLAPLSPALESVPRCDVLPHFCSYFFSDWLGHANGTTGKSLGRKPQKNWTPLHPLKLGWKPPPWSRGHGRLGESATAEQVEGGRNRKGPLFKAGEKIQGTEQQLSHSNVQTQLSINFPSR